MYIEGAANLALIVRNAILMHSLQHAKTHAANLTLIAGAAMSFTDLAFDLVLINEYLGYHVWAAYAIIATVILSLFFQCCVVLISRKGRKKRYILREWFYVVTCVKPGVDAYRVIIKEPIPVGALVSAHDEMLYHRGVEFFTECIPGCLIQVRGCGSVGSDDDVNNELERTRTTTRYI